MKYYRFKYSLNDKEIGKFPQISEGIYDVSINDPLFIDNLGYLEKLYDEVKVPGGVLAYGAKITDLISGSPKGLSGKFLISGSLKSILEMYSYDKAQFFETYILKQGKKFVYWLLHPYHFDFGSIDFKKSIVKIENDKLERVQIEVFNFEDFQKKLQEAIINKKLIFIESISFNIDSSSDLFFIRYVKGGIGCYCSEALKLEIEKNKLTGIEFEPILI